MQRVWVVDDQIPLRALFGGPLSRMDAKLVQHLLDETDDNEWEEPEVRALCAALCAPEYDALFFLTPDSMVEALESGATPPHAVIFDWEYPGYNDQQKYVALDTLLQRCFTYVQV